MVRISDIDIINLLLKDGRMKYTDIAKELNVSEAAIRKRINNMINTGKIKGFTTIIEPSLIGMNSDVIIGLDTTPEEFTNVLKLMKKNKKIKHLWVSTGDHMIMMRVWLKNSDKLYELIKKLKQTKGITKVCPAILVEQFF